MDQSSEFKNFFGVTEEEMKVSNAKAKKEIEKLQAKYGFRIPNRGRHEDTKNWRVTKGMPDYSTADWHYLKGKSQNHPEGSLEETVENLVKTWEMEASHKTDISEWTSIASSEYVISVNGFGPVDGRTVKEIGNYNALFAKCPKYQQLGMKNDFDQSHHLFRNAFGKSFPWEVLKVFYFSEERVVFSWRHWGEFTGKFPRSDGTFNQGEGQIIEITGIIAAGIQNVDDKVKITSLEVFYNPDIFIEALAGSKAASDAQQGKDLLGDITTTAVQKLDLDRLP